MAPGESHLHSASRIYYGIMYPVQYNVKVKDVGNVTQRSIPSLMANWKEEVKEDLGDADSVVQHGKMMDPGDMENDDSEDDDIAMTDHEYDMPVALGQNPRDATAPLTPGSRYLDNTPSKMGEL